MIRLPLDRKVLLAFITAGDPSLSVTRRLISALERGGADLIELGVPFSDPMADGPVIQRASERALANGVSLRKVLKLVHAVRQKSQIPILLMGYYNPILAYGLRKYARDAARARVDATLVVDLPPEESEDLDRELREVGIDLIYLLTPTSGPDRIRRVARRARGFIYFVSITGVTGGCLPLRAVASGVPREGARLRSEGEIKRKIAEIRRHTSLPIAVGFGISKPEQARQMARFADGVVVGSALVSLIASLIGRKPPPGGLLPSVERFVRGLKGAVCEAFER